MSELDDREVVNIGCKYLAKNSKFEKLKPSMAAKPRINRARLRIWILWLILIALLCVYVLQIAHVVCTWRHRVVENDSSSLPALPVPLIREYDNNGYLTVSSNGGLNQMRSGICDMVTVASFMNVTLIVPQLDNTSFWHDQSQFGDIFDVDHFIMSLRDEVRILKELPSHLKKKKENGTYVSVPPVSWSPLSFYLDKVLPQMKKHKLLHFTKTDARLANNGLPLEVQKLRCRVNYKALRFTPAIEKLGKKIIDILRKKGPFLVLHLRYEIDVLAFAGCNEGCTDDEAEELRKLRYRISWWKEKEINSTGKRLAGLCPLTPEETVLTLKALDVDPSMQIYIAAGDAFGGERRLASLRATFPNLVKKENLLPSSDLLPFKNYSSHMAALDYIVSIESDVFFPTYGGNMAKVVEGHRRYLGFKKTIQPDKKLLVDLIDKYNNHKLGWEEFADLVKKTHFNRTGNPVRRVVIPGKPKEEDYFWSNPQECLPPLERRRTI